MDIGKIAFLVLVIAVSGTVGQAVVSHLSTAADYEQYFNPLEYLNQYYNFSQYQDVYKWTLVELKRLTDNVKKGEGRLLEVGIGGVISHLVSAGQKFHHIVVCDHSEKALDVVRDFVSGNGTFDWSSTFRFVANLHGETDPSRMEQQLRRSIKETRNCDFTQDNLFAMSQLAPVDLLISSLALESARISAAQYTNALKRITDDRYLKRGGAVILIVALRETYWNVGNQTFPAAHITKSQVEEALRQAEFDDIETAEFGTKSSRPISRTSACGGNQTGPVGVACENSDSDASSFLIAKAIKRV
ncbi:putative Nicotinamide N-methyltransferase [Hypsibius exemplaris]|uniref:Nicotinamide N-methyltransferase n=1 Tax=Hypsibius exemplaris TaxID=2072580 RepID=A0A9X6ND18_HYPEX|nr:putative Nicotinamide N-methyltransferase [Hypsibius exemplaris]